MKHFRFILKPWFWVLLGAMLTAASALISRYVITENNAAIMLLRQESGRMDEIIRSHWENIGRLEGDGNTALLMAWFASNDKDNLELLQSYTEKMTERYGDKESRQKLQMALPEYGKQGNGNFYTAIVDFVENSRESSIETINQKYLEKLTLEERITQMEHANARHANIAVFLQIIGLIFVLSKDLARRTWPS